MGKALFEMTLEELWELFPIILTEHKEIWNSWYADEHKRLSGVLPIENIRISHIGSTAIDGIWAKPIIDILVELPISLSMENVKEILVQNGYICMSEQPDRKSFNRGYTSEGFAEKVFHLHLRYRGDNDELYFRDYLNDNPLLAKQYEELKLSLWKKFEHNRDGYTFAKTSFIVEQTDKAKKYYGNRYQQNNRGHLDNP
ncbi:MAG: GrpB family protein [Oscillospiraceae bacterium]|nr:GrpB family protein [Oscillospiraceae bacterium]